MKDIVDFLKIAERLECEYRITRMSDNSFQSVASHSWNMATMAIVMEPHFVKKYDMAKVLKLCVLHDLPEAIAHDIPLHQQTTHAVWKKACKRPVQLIKLLIC